jgi:hypothetical protein
MACSSNQRRERTRNGRIVVDDRAPVNVFVTAGRDALRHGTDDAAQSSRSSRSSRSIRSRSEPLSIKI